MITWNSTAFGPDFTPHQRCKIVSQRLTQAVATHGGKVANLWMTYGTVDSSPVICYVNDPMHEYCNSQNLLLTLNQSDRGKEAQILQQLVTFGKNGTGPTLIRAGTRTMINLGMQVDNSLEAGGAAVSPQPQQPTPTPIPSATPSGDNSF